MKFENIGDVRDFHLAVEYINEYVVPKYKIRTAEYNSSQEFINEAIVVFQKHEIDTLAIKLSAKTVSTNGFQIEINPTSENARDFLIQYDLWYDFLKRNEKAAWFGYKKKHVKPPDNLSLAQWEKNIINDAAEKKLQFPDPVYDQARAMYPYKKA